MNLQLILWYLIFLAAQRFALAAAGEKTAWEQYKPEAGKMPVNRADSQPSAARCVGQQLSLFYPR